MNLAMPFFCFAAFHDKQQIIYHVTNWSVLIDYKNCRDWNPCLNPIVSEIWYCFNIVSKQYTSLSYGPFNYDRIV